MDYKNDSCWKDMQKYLPLDNRLTSNTAPLEKFMSIGNINLHIDHYMVEKPLARIVLFHGVGGNGRLLSFIALPLMKNGFEIICPDLPLYGCTKYSGIITYDMWVKCGVQVVNQFHRDTVPIFLFGLSAGGMLAYQVATRCSDISGIIVTCILDQRDKHIRKTTARSPFIELIGNALLSATYRIIGSLKVPMKLVANMRAIANDNDLAELLMRDKKSSGASVQLSFIHSMLNPMIDVEPEFFTQCPFLLVHPENDRWTDIRLSKLFFDRLACNKELHILEGAGHFPVEAKGLKQLEEFCTEFLCKQIQ
ncbi:MAG: alpha/beta hydrolase [Clostridium sp.]|uniref:alpha/beta hydrolase n=1 Tax=Clostridium sp. TaxID=1506 RepID=UPI0029089409|nr:alpha/beta hydrolase [Clostridium sp.]MDU7337530.1 alpha/beta hydrolase [Clostridium sp.]